MPARPVIALVVFGALLVLSVGIGGALFAMQGERARPAMIPQPTTTVAPDTPQIVSLVEASPEPTYAPTPFPDTPTPVVVPTDAPLPSATPVAPAVVIPTATTVVLTPTPRPTPRP